MSEERRGQYEREIIGFLRHCKARHAAATVGEVKRYLSTQEQSSRAPAGKPSQAREALRWFYREGRRRGAAADGTALGAPSAAVDERRAESVTVPALRRSAEPPPAAGDQGANPREWELIRAIRERGFLWRTEQTYREWAARFARFRCSRRASVAPSSRNSRAHRG